VIFEQPAGVRPRLCDCVRLESGVAASISCGAKNPMALCRPCSESHTGQSSAAHPGASAAGCTRSSATCATFQLAVGVRVNSCRQFVCHAKELRKWVKIFPADFYRELFRLRGLPYKGSVKRPQYVGHLTNDLVYSRLAPGVLDELRRVTPRDDKGRLKNPLFQRLTENLGHPRLLEHLASVTALMRACDTWDQFVPMIDRALPRQVDLPLFEGKEDVPQIG